MKSAIISACGVCSSFFVVRGPRTLYCSNDCGVEANRVKSREKSAKRRALVQSGRINFMDERDHVCPWCQKVMVVPFSYTGSKLMHDDCRRAARRQHNRKKTVKRQGAKVVARIDVFELAVRDGFVCHICGGQVDMAVSRKSRFGATIDHVLPISRGGLDVWENVKLAHWICNIRKSDSLEFVDA